MSAPAAARVLPASFALGGAVSAEITYGSMMLPEVRDRSRSPRGAPAAAAAADPTVPMLIVVMNRLGNFENLLATVDGRVDRVDGRVDRVDRYIEDIHDNADDNRRDIEALHDDADDNRRDFALVDRCLGRIANEHLGRLNQLDSDMSNAHGLFTQVNTQVQISNAVIREHDQQLDAHSNMINSMGDRLVINEQQYMDLERRMNARFDDLLKENFKLKQRLAKVQSNDRPASAQSSSNNRIFV